MAGVNSFRPKNCIMNLSSSGSRKPLCILSFKDLSQMGNDVSQGPVSSAAWFKVLDRSPDPTSLSRSQHSRAFSADVEQKEQQALQTAFRMPAYCLLLKGRCLAQLKLAKRCLKLALLSGFNARLESAYLKDACLLPTREFARSQQDKTKVNHLCHFLNMTSISILLYISFRLSFPARMCPKMMAMVKRRHTTVTPQPSAATSRGVSSTSPHCPRWSYLFWRR